MRKLTVDDIVDHRAYEKERDEFRAHIIEHEAPPAHPGRRSRHHRVREHRHDALAGPGDGARRTHAHRRRDRRRGRDLQRAHPRTTASSRARSSSSSPTTPSCASGSRSSSTSSTHVRFDLADGSHVDAVPARRGAPHVATTSPRPSTTSSSRSRPAQRGPWPQVPPASSIDHPDYHAVAELTDEQRAELARDFTE